MSEANNKIYEFADFRLIPGEGLLLRNGEPVNLNPKAFAVLTLLVERHGHLVSKAEITDAIWDDSFVEEGVISKAIWYVRNALGDASKERFIQTVSRRGYRFVQPVSVITNGSGSFRLAELPHDLEYQDLFQSSNGEKPDTSGSSARSSTPLNEASLVREVIPSAETNSKGSETNGETERMAVGEFAGDPKVISVAASEEPRRSRPAYRSLMLFGLGSLIVLGSLAFYLIVNTRGSLSRSSPVRLAVLPFKPLDAQTRDPLYELGMAEQLILKMGGDKKVSVRQLDAIRRYSDAATDAIKAGKELNVDYVVTSNYQVANGRIKVTAYLFDVATGNVQSTLTTEKDGSKLFSAQEAIANDIGNKLLTLFGAETEAFRSKRGTENEEAYRNYLLAVNFNELRGTDNGRKALEHIEKAVSLDPNFARAWAAKAYIHRYVGYGPDARDHYEKSMEAVNRALAIDPTQAEAHSALCFNKLRFEYDFAGAETACKRALELAPDSALAHKLYSNFLYTRGRFDESIAEIKTAMELQPVSYDNQQTYAIALYYARRYAESEAEWRRLIDLNPNHPLIYDFLIKCLTPQGKESEALENLISRLSITKAGDEKIERVRRAYATSGWGGVNLERIRIADASEEPNINELARLYAAVGEKEKAIAYLEKAVRERSNMIAVLQVDPDLDPLRGDSRFEDLVKRIEGQK